MTTITIVQPVSTIEVELQTSGLVIEVTPIGILPDLSNYLLTDGATKITVGVTQPTSPDVGDLWVDTN